MIKHIETILFDNGDEVDIYFDNLTLKKDEIIFLSKGEEGLPKGIMYTPYCDVFDIKISSEEQPQMKKFLTAVLIGQGEVTETIREVIYSVYIKSKQI